MSSSKTPKTILHKAAIFTRSDFRVCGNNRCSTNCQRELFTPYGPNLYCDLYPCVISKFFNCQPYGIRNENLILDVYFTHLHFLSNSSTYNFYVLHKISHLVAQEENLTCPKVLYRKQISPLSSVVHFYFPRSKTVLIFNFSFTH
jgi:hypothetical protein